MGKNKLKSHSKVIAILADTPLITQSIVRAAFNKLAAVDLVIGPDAGSGYYLVGMKKALDIFTPFSHKRVPYFGQTLKLVESLGIDYCFVQSLTDVDYIEDIYKINWADPQSHKSWPRTIQVLKQLRMNGKLI